MGNQRGEAFGGPVLAFVWCLYNVVENPLCFLYDVSSPGPVLKQELHST